MKYQYKTEGTCSKIITFDIDNNIISNVEFIGGCSGNLKMISKLIDGWSADKIIDMCKGNVCGIRKTSCADQLASALEKAKEEGKLLN